MSTHLEGRTISASTYTRHGCRCPDCTAANLRAVNLWRTRHPDKKRAQARRYHARRAAAWRWIIDNRPDIAIDIEHQLNQLDQQEQP